MKMKRWTLASILVLVVVLSACSKDQSSSETDPSSVNSVTNQTETAGSEVNAQERVFTLEELSTYNGKDGNEAYVAVDGIVYDVTGLPAWTGGEHNNNYAGQDLSEAIKNAPHGTSKLKGLTIVGKLE